MASILARPQLINEMVKKYRTPRNWYCATIYHDAWSMKSSIIVVFRCKNYPTSWRCTINSSLWWHHNVYLNDFVFPPSNHTNKHRCLVTIYMYRSTHISLDIGHLCRVSVSLKSRQNQNEKCVNELFSSRLFNFDVTDVICLCYPMRITCNALIL